MDFDLKNSLEILERTPMVLVEMLQNLSTPWTTENEGPETWSPFDIVGHFIHGEKTDWIPRMERILSDRSDKTFEPFDRFAQFRDSKNKSLETLLEEFKVLRRRNLEYLRSLQLTEQDLTKEGRHPELGKVTLKELLASWVVHDLNHIAQISRVMANQYKDEVGPWKAYMGILNH